VLFLAEYFMMRIATARCSEAIDRGKLILYRRMTNA
jgi:hypothetical protein